MGENSKKLRRYSDFYNEFFMDDVPSDAEGRILTAINRCTSLTDEQKSVMICRYIKVETWGQIAEGNGITIEQARSRTVQAFRKLKHPKWNLRVVLSGNN